MYEYGYVGMTPIHVGKKLHEYCCTVYTCFRQYTNRVLAGILIDGS